jgi:hypothetical protein
MDSSGQPSEKRVKNLAQHGFVLQERIRSGRYSDVWRASLEGKESVTIKFFTKDAMNNAMRELSFLGGVTHVHIIKYRKFIFEESAIVMDYASGGNLYDYLKAQTSPIDWRLRMKWAKQIGETVKFLHEKGIIHRDLRCVNILLTDKQDIRLSDFGISLWKGSGEAAALPVHVGKEHYKVTNDKATLTFNFDLRLFGIVLAKLLLFGDDLDLDLWDTKTNSLMLSKLNCPFMPYLQLIELCLSPSSRVGDIMENIESILHDPQLPIPREIIVPKLLGDLPSANEDLRINAARTLGELGIGEAPVVTALVTALHDQSTWVRRYAARSLGLLVKKNADLPGKADVVAALIKTLDPAEDKSVRVEAIRALGPLGANEPKVATALINCSQASLPGVRMETAEALGEVMVNKDDVIKTLLTLLKDSDGWVRMKAASALGKFIGTDSSGTIRKELSQVKDGDADLGVKWAAEQSLDAMEQ